jgi:GNAT superfamily N-acetyltransferase
MIRRATSSDIESIVAMGRKFHAASGVSAALPFDGESAVATAMHLMSDDGALFVAEQGARLVGMAGALKYPHYMNLGCTVAQELFWWVEPDARGGMSGVRLLMALEEWARAEGCKALTMICLPIDSPAEGIYSRFGYRALEKSFVKELM